MAKAGIQPVLVEGQKERFMGDAWFGSVTCADEIVAVTNKRVIMSVSLCYYIFSLFVI